MNSNVSQTVTNSNSEKWNKLNRGRGEKEGRGEQEMERRNGYSKG